VVRGKSLPIANLLKVEETIGEFANQLATLTLSQDVQKKNHFWSVHPR
jgi:hypothetical protein